MLTLHRLSRTIARLTLVWFALFIGSAIASNFIEPAGYQMLCTGGGAMKVSNTGDGPDDQGVGIGGDCPLCAAAAVPLPPMAAGFAPPSALAHALRPNAAAWIAWITAPPLPSRGPPAAFL